MTRLAQRVQALEAELEVLRRQVAVAPAAAAPVAPGATAVPADALAGEVAQLKQQLADLQAGEALASPSGRDYLKGLVKEAEAELGRERQQARAQDFARGQDERKAERTERWKRFATDAHLTWAQEQELNRRLADEEARREQLMAQLRDGSVGFGDVRRGVNDARRATDDAMAKVLDDGQRQQFQAARAEESPRGGGGPGGPGSRRGGAPGGVATP